MWASYGPQVLRPHCCCPTSQPSQRQWHPRFIAGQGFSLNNASPLKCRVLQGASAWRTNVRVKESLWKYRISEDFLLWDSRIRVKRRWGLVVSSAVQSAGEEAGGAGGGGQGTSFRDWVKKKVEEKQKEQVPPGEKVMRMIATATSAPIAQYIAEPVTILHTLDPRVKQAWLMALVVVPARAHISIRLGLVGLLLLSTILSLPRRTWQDQLGRMAFLTGLLFIFTALGTDGVPPVVHTRTPPPSFEGLPEVPQSLSGFKYVLFKLGPLQLTRKGLALATTASSLSFTILQSATLCLATTTPEQLAQGLEWYLRPLLRFRVPVDEIILTLLLSLRFLGLVFDEVRNIALAVVARGVQWKGLKPMETIDILVTLVGRLFRNLLNHSQKIAEAMIARGFKGDASTHRIYFLTEMSLTFVDWLAILALVALLVVSTWVETVIPL